MDFPMKSGAGSWKFSLKPISLRMRRQERKIADLKFDPKRELVMVSSKSPRDESGGVIYNVNGQIKLIIFYHFLIDPRILEPHFIFSLRKVKGI